MLFFEYFAQLIWIDRPVGRWFLYPNKDSRSGIDWWSTKDPFPQWGPPGRVWTVYEHAPGWWWSYHVLYRLVPHPLEESSSWQSMHPFDPDLRFPLLQSSIAYLAFPMYLSAWLANVWLVLGVVALIVSSLIATPRVIRSPVWSSLINQIPISGTSGTKELLLQTLMNRVMNSSFAPPFS